MSDKTKIITFKQVEPKIYAYTTPGYAPNDGFTKIGYTEQEAEKRIRQQTQTANLHPQIEWVRPAIYETYKVEPFKDHDFHRYLQKIGVERMKSADGGRDPEFFRISPSKALEEFNAFIVHHGYPEGQAHHTIPYELRDEQDEAITMTVDYFLDHQNGGQFLWNAKPRFGKTLSVYDFAKRIGAKNVLIVTHYPAIANSWFEDYKKFIGTDDHYRFVTRIGLPEDPLLLDEAGFHHFKANDPNMKTIWFLSFQDLKQSRYFGKGSYDKLKEIADTDWDLLVIDEAHIGVDTVKTDVAFDQIKRKFTLHLSGTPFKALANAKFSSDAIYNWTYADEQAKKQALIEAGVENSPYRDLPTMNLFTYKMSDIVEQQVEEGMELGSDKVNFAFDLNEFFRTSNGKFVYEDAVDAWLDAMAEQEKFPFSTPALRDKLKHTFWILKHVDSVKQLEKKLNEHPVFGEYKIINVAGTYQADDEEKAQTEDREALKRVRTAIAENDKTITLSAGRLTTGITVPEWSAVMMLSNMKSPALYMQTAFRAQNPYKYQDEEGNWIRKENAYVFDFDPARTLDLFEKFALDLDIRTTDGRANSETREEKIKVLLNFFPVIGEDQKGEMVELDAQQVLSIPRKLRSTEVVKRGFMSDFLFQNIGHIFNAPKEVQQLVMQFDPVKAPNSPVTLEEGDGERLNIDENGEIHPDEEKVIGIHNDLFGEGVYGLLDPEEVSDVVKEREPDASKKARKEEHQSVTKLITRDLGEVKKVIEEEYSEKLKKQDLNRWERIAKQKASDLADKLITRREIAYNSLEKEKEQELDQAHDSEERSRIEQEYHQKAEQIEESFRNDILQGTQEFIDQSIDLAIEEAEISGSQKEAKEKTDSLKDHLRGFSRTIPSFLMAYGDENLRLDNLEEYIEPEVFKEVTSITFDEFKMLRDGYTDEQGNHFPGHLFDETVFNDSVREFLKMKHDLRNYFDPEQKDDIFNYVPPQKTNQIFTPRRVVNQMVDQLEAENPGIFDDPSKTFADLYLKSGLYLAEIVRRLYNSEGLKRAFPDEAERLHHIFAHQIYGMAPTRIIYLIARNFVLGFADDLDELENNIVQADASEAAQRGKLAELVDSYFGT